MIQAIRLFEVFKTQFSDEQAKFIVEEVVKMEAEVEPKIEKVFDQRKDVLATKEDIANLRVEMAEGFNRILIWIVGAMIALAAIVIAITKLLH